PLVAHAAVQALASLRAGAACLAAFDSPGAASLVPGATRVLQTLHEERVVDGLLERLARATDDAHPRPPLPILSRLWQREADWDGHWWGTRPDTSGPYFKGTTWAASERILAALRRQLEYASKDQLPWFVLELQKNKVDLPELTPLVLKLAAEDKAFR